MPPVNYCGQLSTFPVVLCAIVLRQRHRPHRHGLHHRRVWVSLSRRQGGPGSFHEIRGLFSVGNEISAFLRPHVLSSFWFWSLWLSRTVALAYIVIEWKVSRVKWLMLSSYVQRVCGLRVGTGLDASVELVKVCMFNPSFWRCCLRSCLIVDKTRFGQIIKQ